MSVWETGDGSQRRFSSASPCHQICAQSCRGMVEALLNGLGEERWRKGRQRKRDRGEAEEDKEILMPLVPLAMQYLAFLLFGCV